MLSHALLIKLLQVKKYRLLQIFPPVIQRYCSVQTDYRKKTVLQHRSWVTAKNFSL